MTRTKKDRLPASLARQLAATLNIMDAGAEGWRTVAESRLPRTAADRREALIRAKILEETSREFRAILDLPAGGQR